MNLMDALGAVWIGLDVDPEDHGRRLAPGGAVGGRIQEAHIGGSARLIVVGDVLVADRLFA
jgi:hypothetical protein